MVRSAMVCLACAMLVIMLAGRAGSEPMFVLTQCKEIGGQSVNLIFRNDESTRFITFMPTYKEFAVRFESPRTQPFIMDWRHVHAVELKRISDRPGGFFSVRLKGWSTIYNMDRFEFGTIDEACWQNLKERFDSDLQFAEIDE